MEGTHGISLPYLARPAKFPVQGVRLLVLTVSAATHVLTTNCPTLGRRVGVCSARHDNTTRRAGFLQLSLLAVGGATVQGITETNLSIGLAKIALPAPLVAELLG
jgi:hypothetical protein